MVERASQLLGDRTACDQSRGMPETMLQKLRFALKRIVVPRFEGGCKVADPAVLTIQSLARYQLLNVSIGVKRGPEHSPSKFLAILFDQHLGAVFEANDHHAAVARRRAPTQALRIENGDRGSAFSQYASCRDTGEACADHHDVGP